MLTIADYFVGHSWQRLFTHVNVELLVEILIIMVIENMGHEFYLVKVLDIRSEVILGQLIRFNFHILSCIEVQLLDGIIRVVLYFVHQLLSNVLYALHLHYVFAFGIVFDWIGFFGDFQ